MQNFNILAATSENTVVTEYKIERTKSDAYQSESALEKEFIKLLQDQGYTYLKINSENDLINNLRVQLEKLNNYTFSNGEWSRFFKQSIANPNEHIVEKTKKIQEDYIQVLQRDDGSSKNIYLIDKKNVHNNILQVINQYVMDKEAGARRDNRYDVTILVNGLPLVHIELKRRGVRIREAFNQINRYQRESFWSGCGLYEYIQIFVISNGTHTKYYSNTTRYNAVKIANSTESKKQKTSNTFEFTSYWTDAKNKVIQDLVDFTKTFFAKHTILNILTRYCVFTSENMLLVMRPYQITATEQIINKIRIAQNYKKAGTRDAGGYIWHTTGSGKTLTSFKAAQLATQLDGIDKVLFVVDRKDLDYQTMKEYDRFEKGAANSNTSTAILERQLRDPDAKIIITTIQKLTSFITKNKTHEIYAKNIVIIFDECHRSQFGKMHSDIVHYFKNYYIFGFTGTPIFAANVKTSGQGMYRTTEDTFGPMLHAYTIVDAIHDDNVLPFRIDYIKTVDRKTDDEDEQVWDINTKQAMEAPQRIKEVVGYVLEHFDQKTYHGYKSYISSVVANIGEVALSNKVASIKENRRLTGFNSIFTASSVPMAMKYYREFKKQISESPNRDLKIAMIYSYAVNEEESDEEDGILDEENSESTAGLDKNARDMLDEAISDYNAMFRTNYSTDGEKFQNYYKDVSLRMKNKEIDILIVVNMFLTGFDATTLNTLWVDKNLKMHGLIQAFSRTNRILNSIKTFGNIVCFRNLQKQVDDAIALFGDREAGGVVLLRKFEDYYNGYTSEDGTPVQGYTETVAKLFEKYPLTEDIIGEQNERNFLKLFGKFLRMTNMLSSFDEFKGKEILTERELQDYTGLYQDIHDQCMRQGPDKKDILDDIVFETELIRQIDVNIDYILMLVQKYHEGHCKDKSILETVNASVRATPELRSKKELIDKFISRLNEYDDVMTSWHDFIIREREEELLTLIRDENLNDSETRKFLDNAFRDGEIKTTGTDIEHILPPMSRFGGQRAEVKSRVISKLENFFEKFYGLGDLFTEKKDDGSFGI